MEHSRGNLDHHGIRWSLGGGGYQFYTTTPVVKWAIWNDALDFCPGGSMIYCKTPVFKKDPLDPEVGFTKEELDNTKLYANPTFSLIEYPPKHNDKYECGWTYMPAYVSGPGNLTEIMNSRGTFAAANAWQINGLAEHVYYSIRYVDLANEIVAPKVKINESILTSHQQPGGHVFSMGLHSPIQQQAACDVGFDMAPQKVRRNMKGQMPDSDWPERACFVDVGSGFIILHTANDEFVCWPYLPENLLDYSITANADSKLKAQGYKANVPSKYAKTVKPAFPSWVHSPDVRRSEKDNPLMQAIEPRVTFSFDSTGRFAVAAMMERIPISDIGSANFHMIDYYEDGDAPREQYSDTPITIDAFNALYDIPDTKELQYDRLGIIGLRFEIKVTGPNLEDFTFSADVVLNISPDEIFTYSSGALVAVGYAKQAVSNPLRNRITGEGSARKAVVLNPPRKDELVTAFMTLYQHEDQKKHDLGRYSSLSTTPIKSKISFYKGEDDFKAASNPILELPLTQNHGSGYAGEAIRDPITGEIISLPVPAHEFVDYSYGAFINRFLAPGDPRPPRYLYSSEISGLDITTLSFYYTATITKKTIDSEAYELDDGRYEYHKNFNEQAQLCNVYVFGKIASDTYVGDDTLAKQLIAWVDNAPPNFPEDNEEMVPTTYKNLDIDLYYAEQRATIDDTKFIWWFKGACGACVDVTVEGFISGYSPYSIKGTVDKYNPLRPFPLSVSKPLTEEGAKELLHYIVGVMGEHYAGNVKDTVNVPDDTKSVESVTVSCTTPHCIWTPYEPEIITFEYGWHDITDYTETYFHTINASINCSGNSVGCLHQHTEHRNPVQTVIDKCRGNINPFKLAKADFDEDKFVEQAAWFFAQYVNILLYNNDNGTDYSPQELLGTGKTNTLDHEDYFGLSTEFLAGKDVFIKKYDWGIHLYNQARRHVTPIGSNTSIYDRIVTTPEGHYSYYYRDHYIIDIKYTAVATECYRDDKKYMSSASTRVGNDEGLTKDSFKWKLVEGIGWYYGLIKTTHMDMYNMAFSEEWRESMREFEKRNQPYALKKELPIRIKYGDEDFSPEFTFELSTSPIRGEPLYSPNKYLGAGNFDTIQTEIPDYILLSRYDFPGSRVFDDREYRKHIRLSPLFF